MKTKISITLDERLLSQIDKLAGKIGINRSRYIEKLLKNDFEQIPVLILAGGGKINDIDKPLVEYNGRKIIDHQISYLKRQDFYDVFVATDSRLVEDYVKRKFPRVRVFFEKKLLGTGGALKYWGKRINKPFVLLHGDILVGIDVKQLVEFHRENKSSMTLVLKSMSDNCQYGVAQLEGSKIRSFVHKPKKSSTYLCYIGVGMINPEMLDTLDDTGYYEFQVNKVANKYGYVYEDFWRSFETAADLEADSQ